ncbi:hypothetical protein VTK73DRAFT_6231 [Phialemonium thermophilum]|uniref:SMP domain-containing protein n=1 Tax=Phialemonium thermophilum TaxID=223376 RepID=A0ABR3WKF6_9PEZI
MDYPDKTTYLERAARGEPITQTEASHLAAEETDMTGFGPIQGGTAATAQSLHDKQANFIAAAGDIARKPASEITKEDAAELQKKETRAAGGVPPGPGSTSSYAQSIADRNEKAREEKQEHRG